MSASADRRLPAHLPREPHTHRPETSAEHHAAAGQSCGCAESGGRLREIGRDVSEQPECVPGHFKVLRHIRPKLACASCQRVFQAAAQGRPIARGLPRPALMAHVMDAKYCDDQPLYRQSGIYARERVELDRSTVAGSVDKGDELIDLLAVAVGRYVLASDKIHGDDTPVKVLAPATGKTRTGRLGVRVRRSTGGRQRAAGGLVCLLARPRRGTPSGALQADAYSGWPRLYAAGDVQEVACCAHAHRPWWDLFRSTGQDLGSLAGQALQRIRALYEIEDDIRGKAPSLRKAQRQARAGPMLEQMRQWLQGLLGRVSAKSDIAQAVRYCLVRWCALTRYVNDVRLAIDNNATERALRGASLGRKNYLFMGLDAGGERAAASSSLVETAKLNSLDPEDYLRQVFERIAEHPINRIDGLLPWNIGRPLRTTEHGKMAA